LARTGRTSPEALVLQAPGGGPVRAPNFLYRVYTPALEATGLDGLTFHRLRHSAGHMMREVGVPLEVIQRRLGHASIRTTADIYGSLPEKVDRAAADQLDQLFKASRSERKNPAQDGRNGPHRPPEVRSCALLHHSFGNSCRAAVVQDPLWKSFEPSDQTGYTL
jgi:hypothetical protein